MSQETHVMFLLDRTGSMQQIKQETIGAFNAYLDELTKDGGNIHFTLLTFDSQSLDTLCLDTPVAQAPRLNDDNYVPRAYTPLIDSSYKAIKMLEERVKDEDAKVIVCIQTDGEENSSQEYSWEQLQELIKEKTEAGWQFNFMGASIDAYKQSEKLGIGRAHTMSYDSSQLASTQSAFRASARNTKAYATGQSLNTAYSTEQKEDAGDAFDTDS